MEIALVSFKLGTSSKLEFVTAAFVLGARKFEESTEIVQVARNTLGQSEVWETWQVKGNCVFRK